MRTTDAAGTPPVTRLLESALYVRSPEQARDWYQGLFGFPVLLADHRLVALDVAGAQVLLLFRRDASSQPNPVPGGVVPPHDAWGRSHLCFAIPRDALAAWEARLAERGIPVESRVEAPHGATCLYVRDPDGHLVELATPGLWATY